MIEFTTGDLGRTYYLAGPMTGYPEYNYPAFQRACDRLRGFGVSILSPHEVPKPEGNFTADGLWEYYMGKTLKLVEQSEGIILLRGWPESKGAKQELRWSLDLKHPVYLYLEAPGRLIRMSADDPPEQPAPPLGFGPSYPL